MHLVYLLNGDFKVWRQKKSCDVANQISGDARPPNFNEQWPWEVGFSKTLNAISYQSIWQAENYQHILWSWSQESGKLPARMWYTLVAEPFNDICFGYATSSSDP